MTAFVRNHKSLSSGEFRKHAVVAKDGKPLGAGAHGTVWEVKMPKHDKIIGLAVKEPRPDWNGNTDGKAEKWVRTLRIIKKAGMPVVPFAKAIDGKLVMTDLRAFGELIDIDDGMNLKHKVSNYREIILQMAEHMAELHSKGYILDDARGTLAFRAWFLMKKSSKGRLVLCDVGGISNRIFAPRQVSYESEKYRYVRNNLISMYNIIGCDNELFTETLDSYISIIKKQKTGNPTETAEFIETAESLKNNETLERLRISYMFDMGDALGHGC